MWIRAFDDKITNLNTLHLAIATLRVTKDNKNLTDVSNLQASDVVTVKIIGQLATGMELLLFSMTGPYISVYREAMNKMDNWLTAWSYR